MVVPSLAATAEPSSASVPLAHALGPIGSGSATDIAVTAAGGGVVGIGVAAASAITVAGDDDGSGDGILPSALRVGTSARDIVVRPGQPRNAQSSGNLRQSKKTRTETPPQSDQLETAPDPSALSNAATAIMLPQGLGSPGPPATSIPTVAGVASGAPPAPAQSPLVVTIAEGSATSASSAMDLASLADAAAAATPTLGVLGLYSAGPYNQSPYATTAVASLRSEFPLAQVQADNSSARVDGTAGSAAAAAAAADIDSGAPLLPPSSLEFLSASVPSSSATSFTPAAAAATTVGGESGAGSSPMPAYSASRATAASTAPVSLDIDLTAGIGPGDTDDTEEEMFLAFLVNLIDPSDPKTLRVRGAMMSRLKGIGRTTVAG